MKFRQLNLNPFLRGRSKSKKKNAKKSDHPNQSPKKGDSNSVNHVTEHRDPNNPRQDNVYFAVRETDIVDLDLTQGSSDVIQREDQSQLELSVDIKSQYRLQLDDYYYPIGNEGSDFQEERCHCDVRSGFIRCDHFVIYGDENQYSSGGSLPDRANIDIDPYSNTIRKVRSRIKTNPWLPSPKLSPLSLTSPSEVLSSSDGDSGSEDSPDEKVDDLYCDNEDAFNDKENVREQSESVLTVTNEAGNKPSLQSRLQLQDLNCRWSIISEGDIDLTSPTIEALRESFSNLEHKVSFEYEDKVDSALESDVTAPQSITCLSINDLLDDSLIQSDDTSSLQSSMTSSEDISSVAEMSSSRESSVMTESEIGATTESENGDNYEDLSPLDGDHMSNENAFHVKMCNMDDSIDAGYSSLSRDSRISSDSDSDSYTTEKKLRSIRSTTDISTFFEEEEEEEEDETEEKKNHEKDIDDEGSTTDTYEKFANDLRKCNAPTSRTFSEVRSSLEEKVKQLRLEKMVVEQKIREAQEAEKIRLQEKLRFKQQMSEQRKEVLLQTLNGLKDKLESQSERLEHNYSEVINMQKKYSRKRHPFLFVVPTPVSS
ncbi:deoxynucleotidyltransferase terminal-interacting protein 2-like isoform X2 [Ylistrum balloti]|nr:deoxynucleotidyltransferase terminal-interacting protein 2-like isoform X2 [Ylistrum balloti]